MSYPSLALCFRILTIIFGVLLWLIGAAILGFSIYLRVDYWLNQYSSASDELLKYTIAVYIFIATGGVIILFCIVGIYGAIRPDKCALVAYMIFLPLIFGLVVGAGIYAYVYNEEIENTIKNSDLLKDLVQKQYGINDRITNAIDFMQKELQCCGGVSYTEYQSSIWRNDVPAERGDERDGMTPLTCCSDYKRYEDTNYVEYRYCRIQKLDPSTGTRPITDTEGKNPFLNQKGCGAAFVALIQTNIGIAAAIAFTIVAVIVVSMIFTGFLLFFMRKSPPLREDDVVYEMARTQEKSAYPSRGGHYMDGYN